MNDLQHLLKNQQGYNGVTLFQHVCELVKRIEQENKKSSKLAEFEQLETLSDLVKQNYFLYKDPEPSQKVNQLVDDCRNQKQDGQIKIINTLLNNYLKAQQDFKGQIQNWLQISRMMEWGGLGFGEQNDYKIQAALKKIARDNDTLELQFFGKILCQTKDYWVIQGRLKKYYTEDLQYKDQEMNGTGINYMTYWVSNDLNNEFVELPVISAEQMQQSRQLKRILSGNLNNKIEGYPKFNGLEKHFLRCQLVRISHACDIAPNGLLKANDDDAKIIEYAEEFKIPELADLQPLEAWVHRLPQILKAGRIYHAQDMSMNEEQRQALLEELLAVDPEQEALKGINEDIPLEPFETNWIVKQIGDQQVFNKEDANVVYNALILKNLRWPGSFTITGNGRYACLYIGYGYKGETQPLFFPQEPKDVVEDPDEQEEKGEPNPKNPINEVEPDSDAEKNNEDQDDG